MSLFFRTKRRKMTYLSSFGVVKNKHRHQRIKVFQQQCFQLRVADVAGRDQQQSRRLAEKPKRVDEIGVFCDMDVSGWKLHPLKGNREDCWPVKVSKNWRLTFEMEDGHAYVVDYEDYHSWETASRRTKNRAPPPPDALGRDGGAGSRRAGHDVR